MQAAQFQERMPLQPKASPRSQTVPSKSLFTPSGPATSSSLYSRQLVHSLMSGMGCPVSSPSGKLSHLLAPTLCSPNPMHATCRTRHSLSLRNARQEQLLTWTICKVCLLNFPYNWQSFQNNLPFFHYLCMQPRN